MVIAETSVDDKVDNSDTDLKPPTEIINFKPGETIELNGYDGKIRRIRGAAKIHFRDRGINAVRPLLGVHNVKEEKIYSIEATDAGARVTFDPPYSP